MNKKKNIIVLVVAIFALVATLFMTCGKRLDAERGNPNNLPQERTHIDDLKNAAALTNDDRTQARNAFLNLPWNDPLFSHEKIYEFFCDIDGDGEEEGMFSYSITHNQATFGEVYIVMKRTVNGFRSIGGFTIFPTYTRFIRTSTYPQGGFLSMRYRKDFDGTWRYYDFTYFDKEKEKFVLLDHVSPSQFGESDDHFSKEYKILQDGVEEYFLTNYFEKLFATTNSVDVDAQDMPEWKEPPPDSTDK